MFHLVQSNLIQVLDARKGKNKTIQNKNKKKKIGQQKKSRTTKSLETKKAHPPKKKQFAFCASDMNSVCDGLADVMECHK